jgi:nitrous oxide reductase accessory protein NosL
MCSGCRALTVWLAVAALLVAIGCARHEGPRVRIGSPCASCGMAIQETHFACVRGSDGHYRQFDSIECLLRDGPARSGESIYLQDYDEGRLCLADTVWVVQGSFPTPMGGGLAAFAAEASARDVGVRTNGRVGRLHEFVGKARS